MEAVEYLKAANRMCDKHFCNDCPLGDLEYQCPVRITSAGSEIPDKVVEIVENWAKANPEKTRKSEFLKLFPNANMELFINQVCVGSYDKGKMCKEPRYVAEKCNACRKKFWNEEVE